VLTLSLFCDAVVPFAFDSGASDVSVPA